MRKAKKAMYFTLDALFATILIGMALILSSKYFISDISQPQVSYYSQDIVSSLSTIRISEVNDTYVKSLITSGDIINMNNTVIEQIGEFYVLNKTDLAENLSRVLSDKLVPDKFGIEIWVNGNEIYNKTPYNKNISAEDSKELISSRRMISGIEKFKPLKGATSKVFLEGIKSKQTSNYLYFGGFIGQGNITQNFTGIPSDADIVNMELELDVGGDFYIYINGAKCQDKFFSVFNMTAQRWNVTDCHILINPGEHNKIDIRFDAPLNQSYVAGGFIRVDYTTQELRGYFEGFKIKYRFPGIKGITNLFDAFYIPGTIQSMNAYLHFKANESSYLTIGGRIIHTWPGQIAEQFYNITDQNLSTIDYANLADDYTLFSNNTVPIRFASYEDVTTIITGGNADVILITDFTGSMKKAVDDWSNGNLGSKDCEIDVFSDPHVRRTRAAQCLDEELVNTVMNYTGNRIWPVFIEDDAIDFYNNPEDKDAIINYIWAPSEHGQNGNGFTCISCAINQGYDILNQYSNSSRNKFIILMTDGVSTHCSQGSCISNSINYGVPQCTGLCDDGGNCNIVDINNGCTSCNNNDGAVNNTIYSAQRAKDTLNVTIYTVGFGPMEACSIGGNALQSIATIGNGTYQHSKNITELRMIYANISYEILEKIVQTEQVITTKGNLTESTLYPDSFIEIEYIPISEQPAFDEIAVSIEEDKFTSCNPSFDIPQGLRVTDAKVTSYSGDHWTDFLSINGNEVYNLASFFLNYVRLGDPFFVYVPVNNIQNGTNTLFIETADSPENKTGCSNNNTIIYTGLIKSSVSYANVLPRSEGCSWTLEFEDGTFTTIKVPLDYTGTKNCFYTNAYTDYDQNDSIDYAAYHLFSNLDYNGNHRIYVNIDEYNLVVNAISVQMIPYPWGPAIAEVRIWR